MPWIVAWCSNIFLHQFSLFVNNIIFHLDTLRQTVLNPNSPTENFVNLPNLVYINKKIHQCNVPLSAISSKILCKRDQSTQKIVTQVLPLPSQSDDD